MTEQKAHAKFSASGSERWLNCPASIAHSENAPPQKESDYALEGTEAHSCLEMILKNHGKNPYTAIHMLRKKFPDEMVDHALKAYQFIADRIPEGAILLCETKVSLEFVHQGMFGTVDAAIVDEFGRLWVFDFKYGAGVPVDPDDNTQMIYYALGIAHKYDYNFSDACLVILQPRAEHAKGPNREWIIEMEELRAWTDKFRAGVEAALDPLANFNANPKWCRWCPGKATCPAISDLALKQAMIDFAPEEVALAPLPVANMIKPEKLSNLLNGISKLETWIDAVKAHALFVMERGAQVPGYKLVKKRSIRKWKDVEKVAAKADMVYGDEAFERKLLSPAQFEKAIKSPGAPGFIEKNTTNESSGVTLVSEDDPRPAFNEIEADFSTEVIETGPVTIEVSEKFMKKLKGKGDRMAAKKKPKAKKKPITKRKK